MKIYPRPSLSSGNPIPLIKETKKGSSMRKPLSTFRLFLSARGTGEIKKISHWGNLLNQFVSGILFVKKLIQLSYHLIYHPSVKSWKTSVYIKNCLGWSWIGNCYLLPCYLISEPLSEIFPLDCWLGISYVDVFHLLLLGAIISLTLFGLDNVENSWGALWIYRDLPRKTIFWFDLCACIPEILGEFLYWSLEVLIQY